MEKKLNCFFALPLREMALRRIAVALVNNPGFLATTDKLPFSPVLSYRSLWIETLGRKIDNIVSKLPLPASLKKEIVPIIKAVGSEIFKWKLIHKLDLGKIGLHVVEKLYWTTAGTIDYRKTAETLVRSDILDTMKRFELACWYCLEDRIPSLWNQLSEMNKKKFCDGRHPSQVDAPNFQLFLPYALKKSYWCRFCPLIRFRRDCFKYSAYLGNKTATEYCFKKLSEEKRKAPLSATAVDVIEIRNLNRVPYAATHETLPDVLCYLLSLMTREEQVLIFESQLDDILRVFFDWPWQDLCLDIADVVWKFLPESGYEDLLSQIVGHIRISGFYLPNFIQQFFLRSPVSFRKFLMDEECETPFFFARFFLAEDSDSMRVFFKNMDALDKERLLFSKAFLRLCDDFLLMYKCQPVIKCIQEAELPREVGIRLKEAFEKFAILRDLLLQFTFEERLSRIIVRKTLSDFLNETNTNTGERRFSADEQHYPAKEICIERYDDYFPFLDEIDTSAEAKSACETIAEMNESCKEKENNSFPFLNDTNTSTAGKRNAEDEAPSQIKKLCN